MRPVYTEGAVLTAIKTVSDLLMIAGKGLNDSEIDTSAVVGRAVSDIKKGSRSTSRDKYSYSSVASAASKLIAIFPVLTSRTVSKEVAHRVQKYIEQQGCMMLQLALQQANISGAANGIAYLKQFHQNLSGNGLDALGDVLNTYAAKISGDTQAQNAATDISSRMYDARVREAITEAFCDQMNFESDDSIVLTAEQINGLLEMFADAENYVVYDTKLNPVSIQDYVVNESSSKSYRVDIKYINEAEDNKKKPAYPAGADPDYDSKYYEDLKAKSAYGYEYYKRNKELQGDIDHDEDRRRGKPEEEKKRKLHNVTPLRDQDIKKMNDASYSMLLVRFYSEDTSTVATEFIVGVKAKLIGCDATEILRRIANDNTDGKFFINLMRTITGELKKTDFLFGLSRTYEDLESTKRKGAQGDLWALLKNRALASKEAVRSGNRNNYSAITTVVISKDDAEDLFREENLDITNVKVARHFMESYNLLGFVICDESTESLSVLFDDGSTVFDEISFTMLDRESQDGGTYKKLINLIANSR